MNLVDVMDEVGTSLESITGLRVHVRDGAAVYPPAAMVSLPDSIDYDTTYARGMDRMTLFVIVVAGRASDRAAYNALAAYCDGSGSGSVKAAVEGGTYTACDTVRVVSAEFGDVTISGTAYLGATFTLDITGQGG